MVSRYRIVVPGPLAEFADGLRRDLAGQGYALDTVTDHVRRLADLSGWLAGRGLTVAELTGEVAGQFLEERRAAGCRAGVSARAFAPVLGYLRGAGAAPPPGRPALVTGLDVLLADYQRYLEAERSLSASTVRHYLRYARWFLAGLPDPLEEALARLSAGQVSRFVLERARSRRGRSRQDMVVLPGLRSLLRYLHVAGHTGLPLAGAVPAGRSWKPGLPRAASADGLRAVLAACDRESAGGLLPPTRIRLFSMRATMLSTSSEDGVDRRFIQVQAGHECDSPTAIYTHVSDDFMNTALRRALAPAFGEG